MKYVAFAFVCFALLSLGFSCKEPSAYHYKVHGKVIDKQGNPISGVSIVLRGFDIQRISSKEAFTGEDGRFEMNFDVNPFEWRQEAHWVFFIRKEGYYQRNLAYPEFSFDDRFRYQGYWYEVYFRNPVALTVIETDEPEVIPAIPLTEAEKVKPEISK